jgi:hypothetical protein
MDTNSIVSVRVIVEVAFGALGVWTDLFPEVIASVPLAKFCFLNAAG